MQLHDRLVRKLLPIQITAHTEQHLLSREEPSLPLDYEDWKSRMLNKANPCATPQRLWGQILDQIPMRRKKINWDLYKKAQQSPYQDTNGLQTRPTT